MNEDMSIEELQQQLNQRTNESVTEQTIIETSNMQGVPAIVEQAPVDLRIADNEQTQFAQAMDAVKLNVLAEAATKDEKFVENVRSTIKQAAVDNTVVEAKKAKLEQQKVDYQSEVLETQQKKNEHIAAENKWLNREKRRQYHYNGVKPIMMFVGIKEPLNLFLLYLLTLILSPFYLLSKLLKGTIGMLIAGASDADRPKAVKRFLWTILGIFAILIIIVVVYLFLKWQGLI